MTHKTWPPPVGTLLILTDAEHLHVPWQNGDVLLVTDHDRNGDARAVRLRDNDNDKWWVTRVHTRPIEETDNDQA